MGVDLAERPGRHPQAPVGPLMVSHEARLPGSYRQWFSSRPFCGGEGGGVQLPAAQKKTLLLAGILLRRGSGVARGRQGSLSALSHKVKEP